MSGATGLHVRDRVEGLADTHPFPSEERGDDEYGASEQFHRGEAI